jgi:hypothetical protein
VKVSIHEHNMESDVTTANILKARDPELAKELKAFRSRLGDLLLDKLDRLMASPRFRELPLDLGDLNAIARVLSMLDKEYWTEADLNAFDDDWRAAIRSEMFGGEFESSKHRIQAAVVAARRHFLEEPGIAQGTLW